jgi:Protein of unknown function (DUF2934)
MEENSMIARTRTEEVLTHEEIARRAYLIWEEEGRPSGRDKEHWRLAEQELMALRRQQERALRGWEKSAGIRSKYLRPHGNR